MPARNHPPGPGDASPLEQLALEAIAARRECAWCEGDIPVDARRDSIYCSKSCRQAAHRFRRGYAPKPPPAGRRLRLAYADPPYPGKSSIYKDHPDYAGEVDHDELVARLVADYPDGWALSTSSRAVARVLRLPSMPDDVQVAAWHRGERPTRSALPLQAWEPVIYRGGRQAPPPIGDGPTTRLDSLATLDHVAEPAPTSLVYHARARLTDPNRVTGAKPAEFLWWLFDLLGALPGDELDDLFPGSGGVSRAWAILQAGPPDAPSRRRDPLDASHGPRDDTSRLAAAARD